ncbi:MAG TPA: CHASE2 domain-containing protein, partial [Abditibacterium sp.]
MRRNSSNWHQRATWGMTLGLIAALALLLALRPGVMGSLSSSFEYDTLDFWFALREARQSRSVGIIAVDEATVRRWNGQSFRADEIALIVRKLKNAGAKGVALNFPTLCDPLLRFQDENVLIEAMRFNGRVVLPLELRQIEIANP